MSDSRDDLAFYRQKQAEKYAQEKLQQEENELKEKLQQEADQLKQNKLLIEKMQLAALKPLTQEIFLDKIHNKPGKAAKVLQKIENNLQNFENNLAGYFQALAAVCNDKTYCLQVKVKIRQILGKKEVKGSLKAELDSWSKTMGSVNYVDHHKCYKNICGKITQLNAMLDKIRDKINGNLPSKKEQLAADENNNNSSETIPKQFYCHITSNNFMYQPVKLCGGHQRTSKKDALKIILTTGLDPFNKHKFEFELDEDSVTEVAVTPTPKKKYTVYQLRNDRVRNNKGLSEAEISNIISKQLDTLLDHDLQKEIWLFLSENRQHLPQFIMEQCETGPNLVYIEQLADACEHDKIESMLESTAEETVEQNPMSALLPLKEHGDLCLVELYIDQASKLQMKYRELKTKGVSQDQIKTDSLIKIYDFVMNIVTTTPKDICFFVLNEKKLTDYIEGRWEYHGKTIQTLLVKKAKFLQDSAKEPRRLIKYQRQVPIIAFLLNLCSNIQLFENISDSSNCQHSLIHELIEHRTPEVIDLLLARLNTIEKAEIARLKTKQWEELSAIFIAEHFHNLKKLVLLLQLVKNINTVGSRPLLHMALRRSSIADANVTWQLVKNYGAPGWQPPQDINRAYSKVSTDAMDLILAHGADVNIQDDVYLETALHIAAEKRSVSILLFLIAKYKANQSIARNNGDIFLHALFSQNTSYQQFDDSQHRPIQHLSFLFSADKLVPVELLFVHNKAGQTPIELALQNRGTFKVVLLYLTHFHILSNPDFLSVLQEILSKNSHLAANFVLAALFSEEPKVWKLTLAIWGNKISSESLGIPLALIVKEASYDAISTMLSPNMSVEYVNQPDAGSVSALMHGVFKQDPKLVAWLLTYKLNIDYKHNHHLTALHHALVNKDLECVVLLLNAHADFKHTILDYRRHLIVGTGTVAEAIKLFSNWLFVAAKTNDFLLAKFCLEFFKVMNRPVVWKIDEVGNTTAHYAGKDMLKLLTAHGATTQALNHHYQTPFDLLDENERKHIAQELVISLKRLAQLKADLPAQDPKGHFALFNFNDPIKELERKIEKLKAKYDLLTSQIEKKQSRNSNNNNR